MLLGHHFDFDGSLGLFLIFPDAMSSSEPFGRLVYLMPPFIINDKDLETLTDAVVRVIGSLAE